MGPQNLDQAGAEYIEIRLEEQLSPCQIETVTTKKYSMTTLDPIRRIASFSKLKPTTEFASSRETVVRWSSAKGIGHLTSYLTYTFGEEVFLSVLQLFSSPGKSDRSWQDRCLFSISLPKVVYDALHYGVQRGPHSIGSHIRDVVVYVCWAFGCAHNHFAMKGIVDEILCNKICRWGKGLRELASSALSILAKNNPEDFVNCVKQKLIPYTWVSDLGWSHGEIVAVGESVLENYGYALTLDKQTVVAAEKAELLKSEPENVKEKRTQALNDEKHTASSIRTLLEEKIALMSKLGSSKEEEAKKENEVQGMNCDEQDKEKVSLGNEIQRLADFLKYESQEGRTQWKNLLKGAESEVVYLRDVLGETKVKSINLQDNLMDRGNKLQGLDQEFNVLKTQESTSPKEMEELTKLLEESRLKSSTIKEKDVVGNGKDEYDMLPIIVEFSEHKVVPEKLFASGLPQKPQLLSSLQQQYMSQWKPKTPIHMQQLSAWDEFLLLKNQQQKQELQVQLAVEQLLLSWMLFEPNLDKYFYGWMFPNGFTKAISHYLRFPALVIVSCSVQEDEGRNINVWRVGCYLSHLHFYPP